MTRIASPSSLLYTHLLSGIYKYSQEFFEPEELLPFYLLAVRKSRQPL